MAAAGLAGFYNIPMFVWGLTSSKVFTDRTRFPTTVPFSVNSYSLALAIREVMLQYGWEQFVFLYSNDGDPDKCESLKDDIQVVEMALFCYLKPIFISRQFPPSTMT